MCIRDSSHSEEIVRYLAELGRILSNGEILQLNSISKDVYKRQKLHIINERYEKIVGNYLKKGIHDAVYGRILHHENPCHSLAVQVETEQQGSHQHEMCIRDSVSVMPKEYVQ